MVVLRRARCVHREAEPGVRAPVRHPRGAGAGRTGDFEARWNAERAAGKPSIDVRSSGSPENRRLAARDLDQPFGTLPALQEPGVEWIVDPLVDVKAGHGHTLHFTAGGYFLLVNNKLVPPEMGPKSYRDLEDPKYKGLILLSEPIGPSPGLALGGLRLARVR